jgi:hypothetical protein
MRSSMVFAVDKRALLHSVSHRLARVVAAEKSPYAEALFGVLLERFPARVDPDEWKKALAELDSSDLTVGAWLALEAQR